MTFLNVLESHNLNVLGAARGKENDTWTSITDKCIAQMSLKISGNTVNPNNAGFRYVC